MATLVKENKRGWESFCDSIEYFVGYSTFTNGLEFCENGKTKYTNVYELPSRYLKSNVDHIAKEMDWAALNRTNGLVKNFFLVESAKKKIDNEDILRVLTDDYNAEYVYDSPESRDNVKDLLESEGFRIYHTSQQDFYPFEETLTLVINSKYYELGKAKKVLKENLVDLNYEYESIGYEMAEAMDEYYEYEV